MHCSPLTPFDSPSPLHCSPLTPFDPPHPECHRNRGTSPSLPNAKPANASIHARFVVTNQSADTRASISQTSLL
jgi:hypothetical protein